MNTFVIVLMMALLLAAPCRADSGFKEGAKEVGKGYFRGIRSKKCRHRRANGRR